MFLAKRKIVLTAAIFGVLLLSGGDAALPKAPAVRRLEGQKNEQTTDTPEPSRAVEAKAESAWRLHHKVSGLKLRYDDMPVFSTDGKVLAAIDSAENSIQFRDAHTGELRKTLAVNKKMTLVPGLTLSADGSTVVVPGATFQGYFRSNALKVFDVGTDKELLSLASDDVSDKQGADCYPDLLVLSPDGQRLAWTNAGGFSRFLIWDRTTTNIIRPSPRSTNIFHQPTRLLFSPDGKTLACGAFWGTGGRVYFFDAATGKENGWTDLSTWSTRAMTFLPDGKTLAVADFEGDPTDPLQAFFVVNMVDRNTRRVSKKHTGPIVRGAGAALISSSRDAAVWVVSSPHEIIVWDLVTGKEDVVLRDKTDCQAVISPDGRTLAIVQAQADDKYKSVLSLWRRSETADTPGK